MLPVKGVSSIQTSQLVLLLNKQQHMHHPRWRHVLAGLRTLRLGLSGIRCLALDLPRLTVLDVTGASKLQCLELRCPTLLTAYFKTCRCACPSAL